MTIDERSDGLLRPASSPRGSRAFARMHCRRLGGRSADRNEHCIRRWRHNPQRLRARWMRSGRRGPLTAACLARGAERNQEFRGDALRSRRADRPWLLALGDVRYRSRRTRFGGRRRRRRRVECTPWRTARANRLWIERIRWPLSAARLQSAPLRIHGPSAGHRDGAGRCTRPRDPTSSRQSRDTSSPREASPDALGASAFVGDAIVVDGLVKRYGGLVAVGGISFAVEAGTIFGLLGRNGAGKTTTLETCVGLVRPRRGRTRARARP